MVDTTEPRGENTGGEMLLPVRDRHDVYDWLCRLRRCTVPRKGFEE